MPPRPYTSEVSEGARRSRHCSGAMYSTVPMGVEPGAALAASEVAMPEVGEHHAARLGGDEHVLGLQVAVDDAGPVRGLHRAREVLDEPRRLRRGEAGPLLVQRAADPDRARARLVRDPRRPPSRRRTGRPRSAPRRRPGRRARSGSAGRGPPRGAPARRTRSCPGPGAGASARRSPSRGRPAREVDLAVRAGAELALERERPELAPGTGRRGAAPPGRRSARAARARAARARASPPHSSATMRGRSAASCFSATSTTRSAPMRGHGEPPSARPSPRAPPPTPRRAAGPARRARRDTSSAAAIAARGSPAQVVPARRLGDRRRRARAAGPPPPPRSRARPAASSGASASRAHARKKAIRCCTIAFDSPRSSAVSACVNPASEVVLRRARDLPAPRHVPVGAEPLEQLEHRHGVLAGRRPPARRRGASASGGRRRRRAGRGGALARPCEIQSRRRRNRQYAVKWRWSRKVVRRRRIRSSAVWSPAVPASVGGAPRLIARARSRSSS